MSSISSYFFAAGIARRLEMVVVCNYIEMELGKLKLGTDFSFISVLNILAVIGNVELQYFVVTSGLPLNLFQSVLSCFLD